MKIAPAQIRTSQLYFNVGDVEEFKDEIVVTAWVDAPRVLKAFGFIAQAFPTLAQIADYGFCQMRLTKAGTVEFVTTIRDLKKTVEAVRGFLKAKRWAKEMHAQQPTFVIKSYGDQGALRQLRIAKAAARAGCEQRNNLWAV